MPAASVHRLIKSYVQHNFEVVNYKHRQGLTADPLPPGVEDWLLSRETLQRWVLFSIPHRCLLIEAIMEFRICPARLIRLYKEHRIRHCAPQLAYQAELKHNPRVLHDRRVQFARDVLQQIEEDPNSIIYIDEASINTWMA